MGYWFVGGLVLGVVLESRASLCGLALLLLTLSLALKL